MKYTSAGAFRRALDARLAAQARDADRSVVRSIGGVSIAESGLAYGELMDAPVIHDRILRELA